LERVKKSTFVILSEAKDLRSLLRFNDLRTTPEILRFAQDDTFRILSDLLGERVSGDGVFSSRRRTGEGPLPFSPLQARGEFK
jgi:hypothetical protein